MLSSEIRKLFLDYFVSKQHELVKSSPLIPKDDPTILFTNAGMVQFKRVFLGEEKRPYSRATSCQKCMRAGGKHSDLENVGFTSRHHTFFEMLGNFSFGDYFKKEAIFFAWEFLIEYLKLPKENLWVSIYKEDEEAATIWERDIGIRRDRIVGLGEQDNFWQMGDTGPCGPCSEIIIDQGEEFRCGPDCSLGCDCDRFVEIWNLVFMQFNRQKDGTLTPLPKPSIDTGMGLERITAIMQGKKTNFETDLFQPIISEICSELNVCYGKNKSEDISIRVIADHARASTFLISEGLIPSNEGRGYVLRRIIRRAARHIRLLGKDSIVFYKFVNPVVESLGEVYPEIVSERERVEKILKVEEERFSKTLDKAQKIFEEIVSQAKKSAFKVIPGEDVFKLYDTYGLPIDLLKDMAHDSGMLIDEEGFLKELEKQRQRARATVQQQEIEVKDVYKKLISTKTEFLGYTNNEVETTVEAIIKDGVTVNFLEEGQEGEIFLKETPFYAEAGGQVGDTGVIISPYGKAEVLDTKRILGLHCHIVRVTEGVLNQTDKVFAKIDLERRKAIARNHTATHLLHAALRIVVGDHIKQAGSLVAPDRLRFDFTHFEALKPEEIREVERLVNEKILEDLPVQIEIKSLYEALSEGVIALFEDKYEDTVRVVKIFGFSKELCGGTHCTSTGQIGSFYIIHEGSVASGIRRVEAITGTEAFKYITSLRDEIKVISLLLKTAEPVKSVERLLLDIKTKQQEIENLKDKILTQQIEDILKQAKEIKGVKVITAKLKDLEIKDLKLLSDKIRQKTQSAVVLLTSNTDGQLFLVLSITKDLVNRYNADQLLKEITKSVGGKGGGKADIAQGGCPDGASIDKIIETLNDLILRK